MADKDMNLSFSCRMHGCQYELLQAKQAECVLKHTKALREIIKLRAQVKALTDFKADVADILRFLPVREVADMRKYKPATMARIEKALRDEAKQ